MTQLVTVSGAERLCPREVIARALWPEGWTPSGQHRGAQYKFGPRVRESLAEGREEE